MSVWCCVSYVHDISCHYASNTHHVQIYRKLDPSKSGYIKLSEMKRYLLVGFHPDVISGNKSEEEVILEVTNLFAVRKSVGWHLSTPSQLIPWAVSQDMCCNTLNTSWVVYVRLGWVYWHQVWDGCTGTRYGMGVPAPGMGWVYWHQVWDGCTGTRYGMGVLAPGMGWVYWHQVWDGCTGTRYGMGVLAPGVGWVYWHQVWDGCTCTRVYWHQVWDDCTGPRYGMGVLAPGCTGPRHGMIVLVQGMGWLYWSKVWDGCTGAKCGICLCCNSVIMISDFQIYLSPLVSWVGTTIDTSRAYLGSGSLSLHVTCTHRDTNKAHK